MSNETQAGNENVIRLGWISLLNDVGSETILRLVPFYVSGVLGGSMQIVGTIEGLAEATSTLLKPYFGKLSDRLSRRKSFVLTGYLCSSLARPLLILATSPFGVGLIRVLDRFGKAIRTAPRDALISVSPSLKEQGHRFGINRAMDTVGAVIGISLFAAFIYLKDQTGDSVVHLTSADWKTLCLASLLPSLACLGILTWGVREVVLPAKITQSAQNSAKTNPILQRYLFTVAVFSLANSSDAFILLRARDLGYSLLQTLGMILLLNLFSSASALPISKLSDRWGRKVMILVGWMIYGGTYLAIGLGFASHSALIYAGVLAIYGLFYGFTESVEKAWIADLTPNTDRGRVFGWFGFTTGVTALPASALFGWAWDRFGEQVPFLGGAALAFFAAFLLFILVPAEAQISLKN